MPKKRTNPKEVHIMSDNPEAARRQPNPLSVIAMLNLRLDQKATEIRRLENVELTQAALLNDLTAEVAALTAALDQAQAHDRDQVASHDQGEAPEPVG